MAKKWNWTKDEPNTSSHNLPQQNMQNISYFRPVANFYKDMDRVFEQAMKNFGGLSLPSIWGGNTLFMPTIDISSTDQEYTIDVEAPGMNESDIRIDLSRDGELCICGEKKLENDNQEKDFHHIERAYGSFSRTLTLPEDVDQDAITAEFNNGVLRITAPRRETQVSQGRRIDIGSANETRGRNRQQQGRQENRQEAGSANTNTPKRAA